MSDTIEFDATVSSNGETHYTKVSRPVRKQHLALMRAQTPDGRYLEPPNYDKDDIERDPILSSFYEKRRSAGDDSSQGDG